jgi:alcohol oxidase
VTWHRWFGDTLNLVSINITPSHITTDNPTGETARRMEAYAGEVQAMHPFYAYDSPARAKDMDLATTKAYALPGNLTAGIQHGSWSMPVDSGRPPKVNFLNSNAQNVYEDLKYSKEDIEHVEEWVKRHVETTWHSLGVSSFHSCYVHHLRY